MSDVFPGIGLLRAKLSVFVGNVPFYVPHPVRLWVMGV